MAAKRNRLKTWPLWASHEYQAALVAVRRLRMDSQEGLWRIRNGNSGKITRLLRRLPQYARDANLAGLTALALKREHQEERWPRWALQALTELTDGSSSAIYQAEAAGSAARRRDWAEVERLLGNCLAVAQTVELLLLTGPPPDGVEVSKLEF